jgi:hypothetical protein
MCTARNAIQQWREVIEMRYCSECKNAIVIYNESPCYGCVMGFKDAFEQKKEEE